MNRLTILTTGILTALALLAIGCSGGGDSPNAADGAGTASGAIVPADTHLTFQGQRYQLVHLLQADLVRDGEFRSVGATTEADIDFDGQLEVYERVGDSDAVYTFAPPTEDDVAFWLRWQRDT